MENFNSSSITGAITEDRIIPGGERIFEDGSRDDHECSKKKHPDYQAQGFRFIAILPEHVPEEKNGRGNSEHQDLQHQSSIGRHWRKRVWFFKNHALSGPAGNLILFIFSLDKNSKVTPSLTYGGRHPNGSKPLTPYSNPVNCMRGNRNAGRSLTYRSRGKNKSPDEHYYVFFSSISYENRSIHNKWENVRLCRIPFILAQNKKDLCFEGGGQCLSTQTAPAQCDSAVITFPGVIASGGAKWRG